MNRSALEICRIVGGELVTTLVESVDGELRWSYSSKSSSGEGPVLGNPAQGYEAAQAAAELAIREAPKKVHSGPLLAGWDQAVRRGRVYELSQSGKALIGTPVADFPTKAEAVKYVDEWRKNDHRS